MKKGTREDKRLLSSVVGTANLTDVCTIDITAKNGIIGQYQQLQDCILYFLINYHQYYFYNENRLRNA
jgi:hypothetical protein